MVLLAALLRLWGCLLLPLGCLLLLGGRGPLLLLLRRFPSAPLLCICLCLHLFLDRQGKSVVCIRVGTATSWALLCCAGATASKDFLG